VTCGENQTGTKGQGRKIQISYVDVFLFDVNHDWMFAAAFEELVGELGGEKKGDDEG
jgi:hypothetical protein